MACLHTAGAKAPDGTFVTVGQVKPDDAAPRASNDLVTNAVVRMPVSRFSPVQGACFGWHQPGIESAPMLKTPGLRGPQRLQQRGHNGLADALCGRHNHLELSKGAAACCLGTAAVHLQVAVHVADILCCAVCISTELCDMLSQRPG